LLPSLATHINALADDIAFDATTISTPGERWPMRLAEALSTSKVMLVLWTPLYDDAHWCDLELTNFLTREADHAGLELVLPLVLNNPERFKVDPRLGDRDFIDISNCTNTWNERSPIWDELDLVIRKDVAPALESLIAKAPDWNPKWFHESSAATQLTFTKTRQIILQGLPGYQRPA
jgi:hypothetical protein